MAKVKVLKENELIGGTDNSSVYPITHTKAVFNSDNKELDKILKDNENRVIKLESKLSAYPSNPLDIPIATITHNGLLSAADKKNLIKEVTWTANHYINTYTEYGEFHIHGERTNKNDGLPLLNAASGHTIDAMLTVLDSSLTNGSGTKTDNCVTQILRISNRTGGDGHVYVRTGQATSKSQLASAYSTYWSTWEKLMGVFEKNAVANLDDLDGYTTNGMYSGLYAGTSPKNVYTVRFIPGDTFLMITINGYAASQFATPQITQLLYKLPAKMSTSEQNAEMYIRTGYWNADDKKWVWGTFSKMVTNADLSAQVAALTAKINQNADNITNLNSTLAAAKDDITSLQTGKADKTALDETKETAEYAKKTAIECLTKNSELDREIGKEIRIVKSAPEDASGLAINGDTSTIVEALNVEQALIFFAKKAQKYLFDFNTQYALIFAYKTSVTPSVGVVVEKIRIYKNQETIFDEDLYLLFSYNKTLNPAFSVEMLAPETGISERLTRLENKAPDIIVDTLLPDVAEDDHVPSTKLFVGKIKDVTNIIEGEHTIEMKFEAPLGFPTATVNDLNDGESYNLKVSIKINNFIRIGFGKTESATIADADNYKSIFASSTIGEYNQEIVAPSKEEYPYIISYRDSNDNTAKIVKETETEGLEDRLNKAEQDIEQLKNNPNSDVLDKSQTIVFKAAQTIDTRNNPITCDIKKDDIVYLDVYGYNVPYVSLMVREKGAATFTDGRLTQENSNEVYLNKGDRHWFRASKNIDAIAFWVSNSVVKKNGSFHVRVRNPKSLQISSQLLGRKILMFGDSITQMPEVMGALKENCKGIVEYFSEITGAEAIRCAIGGTCISRKGEITDGVKDREDASRAKQICSMVEYSMTGKQEYLRQAADLTIDDGSVPTDISTKDILYTLANIDMNTVDAITIFGGTNDSTAGVQLSSDNDFDYTTLRGGLNTIIKAVSENYPHIKIFIFTPIVRYYVPDGATTDEIAFADGNWCDNYVLSNGKHLYDYADEIIRTAKENHIPVCDLYREMNWNKDTFKRYLFRKAVGTNIDGTHPRFGFEKIAEKMASFIIANW